MSTSSGSVNVPPSNVSSLAWNQRAQRLRKRNGAGRTKRQQRLLAIFVAGMVGLVLIVVHVELSLLHKATSGNNKNLVMDPRSSNNNRRMSSHKMTHKKAEPADIPAAQQSRTTAQQRDKKVNGEEEDIKQKEAEVQDLAEDAIGQPYHAEMDQHPEEKENEVLKKDDNQDEPQDAAIEEKTKKRRIRLTKGDPTDDAEDHSDLKALIARTEEHLNTGPPPKSADFCDPSLSAPSGPAVAPAVIVLGMEDTSTNLFWHVLSQAMPEDHVVLPSHPQKSSTLQYGALDEMDQVKEDEFWESLPLTDKGAWVTEAFCSQQSNEAKMLGFPWLTLGDMSKNGRAIETLQAIAKLPKDSVKVIRYRRNVLDMISRQEQYETQVREGHFSQSITLDKKTLLKSMTHWNAKQKAVDKFLEEAEIPHITVDHEMLFPFNDWRDLVNVTTIVHKYQVPLNVKIDFSKIAPDERPPEASKMELEWTKVLDYLNIKHPTTLYDLFKSAYSFPQKGAVFWRQQQSLTNYAAVQQVLTGTHFQDLLRNLEYHHDFYGCACNDKEANRARLWKAFKQHKTKEEQNAAK